MVEAEEDIKHQLAKKRWAAAFDLLVNTFSKRLYWHIRKIVLIHEDADDVLQNTFINVWKGLPKFRQDSKMYTWLYRIATNEALGHLRKQKQQTVEVEGTSWEATSDAHFNGDEAQTLLWNAIAMLPEKQRVVFTMKYVDEMKYEAMAEILETSVGALKASYHHATQKIKDVIKEKDFFT